MVLDIDIHLGGSKGLDFSPEKLKNFLRKKCHEMIEEKFVVPNRKYIRIPGVPKMDPLGKAPSYKVKSEVDVREQINYEMSDTSPRDLDAPETEESVGLGIRRHISVNADRERKTEKLKDDGYNSDGHEKDPKGWRAWAGRKLKEKISKKNRISPPNTGRRNFA